MSSDLGAVLVAGLGRFALELLDAVSDGEIAAEDERVPCFMARLLEAEFKLIFAFLEISA